MGRDQVTQAPLPLDYASQMLILRLYFGDRKQVTAVIDNEAGSFGSVDIPAGTNTAVLQPGAPGKRQESSV